MSEQITPDQLAGVLAEALRFVPDQAQLARVRRDALYGPRYPASIKDIFRFIPEPLGTRITGDDDIEAALLRWEFADQARDAFGRHDDTGADALMRLANEITPDAIRFMAEQTSLMAEHYPDERIPGFVAEHYTGDRGEVHIPSLDATALSKVTLPPSLLAKLGLGE